MPAVQEQGAGEGLHEPAQVLQALVKQPYRGRTDPTD